MSIGNGGSGGSSGMNWSNFDGGLGMLGGGLTSLFGGDYTNPAQAGQPYFNQIPGIMNQMYNPYINAGHSAMSQLQGQYSNLMNNPGGMVNQMGQSFHQSPGFQFQTNQALAAANRAAAAGGMLGTPQEQQNIAGTVNGMANQDYYNYLSHAMGMYGMGLQGMQGLNQMGFNASQDSAIGQSDALQNQAQMAYNGQMNQNQNNQSGFGNMLGGLGSMASAFGGSGLFGL